MNAVGQSELENVAASNRNWNDEFIPERTKQTKIENIDHSFELWESQRRANLDLLAFAYQNPRNSLVFVSAMRMCAKAPAPFVLLIKKLFEFYLHSSFFCEH